MCSAPYIIEQNLGAEPGAGCQLLALSHSPTGSQSPTVERGCKLSLPPVNQGRVEGKNRPLLACIITCAFTDDVL